MAISAIHDRINKESTERRKEFEKAHANLKGTPFLFYRAPCLGIKICRPVALALVLDAARTSSARPPSGPACPPPSNTQRTSTTSAPRISLAKALNDADSSVTSKQAELTRLEEELRELEEGDPAAECELDGTA